MGGGGEHLGGGPVTGNAIEDLEAAPCRCPNRPGQWDLCQRCEALSEAWDARQVKRRRILVAYLLGVAGWLVVFGLGLLHGYKLLLIPVLSFLMGGFMLVLAERRWQLRL